MTWNKHEDWFIDAEECLLESLLHERKELQELEESRQ